MARRCVRLLTKSAGNGRGNDRRRTDIALQTDIAETTTLGGRYRLLRRIGAGGMGTVWEAEDRVLKRRVAVKILAPSLCSNASIAARFEREAQAAGRLAHPNIAQAFDYGEDDGCPYIVLELVPGSTLRQLLDARGRLPADDVMAIGAQIADALVAAHAEGVVHRDVKPGNVMVAPDGRVKVMDFGIADAVWFEPITDTGTFLATAKYVSPEQATGGAATASSDVYSMGVVLYELVAGRPPFDGESPFAVAYAHAHDVAPPLERLVPDAPEVLLGTVEAAMRKDPRRRPSAAQLGAGLRRAASDGTRARLVGASDATAVAAAMPVPVEPRPHSAVGTETSQPAPPAVAVDARARRAALRILAGIVLLAIFLSLALTAFSSPPERPSRGDARQAAPASGTGADAGAGSVAPVGDGGGDRSGTGGQALGHDPGHGGGHGNEGHGGEGHGHDN